MIKEEQLGVRVVGLYGGFIQNIIINLLLFTTKKILNNGCIVLKEKSKEFI